MSSSIEETLDEVFGVAKGDKLYEASIKRIRNELERLLTKGKGDNRAKVMMSYGENSQAVGFAILVRSPEKMKLWQNTFVEEGWVDPGFKIRIDAMELMYVYVQAKYRRLGRASQLLKQVLGWARENGVKAVYAYVADKRNVAIDFYMANGAKLIYENIDEEVEKNIPGNGKPLRSAFLWWELTK